MTDGKLNFGILGAGHIAAKTASVLDFLRNDLNPYAISSRDISKAEELKSRYGFKAAYGSYSEMLADKELDVVYIATPNSLHYEHMKMCLDAGKHIICEKPFTMKSSEAEEIFAIAAERKLFVLEAVWTRFQPAAGLIRGIIESGEIGSPRFIQSTFALAISHKERLRSSDLGGGALYDLGIYTLNYAAMYFGLDDIARIDSSAVLTEEGVDDQSTVTIVYKDGRMASLSTSMTAAYGTSGRISGTLGCITTPELTQCRSFSVRKIPSGEERTVECGFDFNGYEYEFRAAVRAIAEGKLECAEMPWRETVAITRIMEELCEGWRKASGRQKGSSR